MLNHIRRNAEDERQLQRRYFFKFLRDEKPEFQELLEFLIQYEGPLFEDEKRWMKEALHKHVSEANGAVGEDFLEQIWTRRGTNLDFIARAFPSIFPDVFSESAGQYREILIHPQRVHSFEARKSPMKWRGNSQMVQPFCIREYIGGELFVNMYHFMYLDSKKEAILGDLYSRKFYKSVLHHTTIPVSEPVVLIRDRFDGANFSHFLFDWVPRIIFFIEKFPSLRNKAVFVLGGIPGTFQTIIIDQICIDFGLSSKQFWFPDGPCILSLKASLFAFSDQGELSAHPANFGNAATVDRITALLRNIPISAGAHRRVFIARSDASSRRIKNEDRLIEIAARKGFEAFALSRLSVPQQISLIKGAEVIIGAHGMGFTHAAFSANTPKILELFNEKRGTDAYAIYFGSKNFSYNYLIGQDIGDDRLSYIVNEEEFDNSIQL